MDHRGPNQVKREVQSEAVSNKERRRDAIFVNSKLDDYGLTLIEFRLCARVARRGNCYQGLPSLANDFRVSQQTIRRALRVLVRCNALSERRTPGHETVYTLNPLSQWTHAAELEELRASVFGKPRKRRCPPGRKKSVTPNSRVSPDTGDRGNTRDRAEVTHETGAPLPLGNDEGTPFESTPQKVLPHTREIDRKASSKSSVCVAEKQISYERYKAYAIANPRVARDPRAWAAAAVRDPAWDDSDVLAWEQEEMERTQVAAERCALDEARRLAQRREIEGMGSSDELLNELKKQRLA